MPWLDKVILGTPDTPRQDLAREPRPFTHEVAFILSESARYLSRVPIRADVRSCSVGLRPLVKPPENPDESTRGLSREHTVLVSRSGRVTESGGLWSTYRALAEDVVRKCMDESLLSGKSDRASGYFHLVGAEGRGARRADQQPAWACCLG